MTIVLSQRIDTKSSYEDIPFVQYHYPSRYKNQIHTGDIFVYYQGDRFKKENRYYFGAGVIGNIESNADGTHYYAKIIDHKVFKNRVPIYHPDNVFYESIDYQKVRNKPSPAWQNSIRKISQKAFDEIMEAAECDYTNILTAMSNVEGEENDLKALTMMNDKYRNLVPEQRSMFVNAHLDRGSSIVRAVKNLLGAKCQICGYEGFEKLDGNKYIEAHHLSQLALLSPGSLCTDNIILVCPNCHREIHYGRYVEVSGDENSISIKLGNKDPVVIMKNSIEKLRNHGV